MNSIENHRAESLANKLDSLNKYFDITESTVSEISKHLSVENDAQTYEIIDENDSYNIISINTLKGDFKVIRDTLLDTINNGKRVIGTITANISDLGAEDPEMISAYASLVGTVNSSLKLLTETYKNILNMQKMINEEKKPVEKNPTVSNLTINTINASVDEIIKSMRNK